MNIHFVSFIGLAPGVEKLKKRYGEAGNLRLRQRTLSDSALNDGDVDVVHEWNRERLVDTQYYAENRALLDQPRGCGYWAWKPYIILQTLAQTQLGDYVVYCDVGRPSENAVVDHGNVITASLRPLIEWAERHDGMLPGVYLSNHGPAKHWIKRDCFRLMDCDQERYHNGPTIQAGYTVWKNTATVINFLQEWQQCNLDSRLISDQQNTLGLDNYLGFTRHCHDQATLTLLCEKRGVSVFGARANQFWGFRNINYITLEAAYQNASHNKTLLLNAINREVAIVPKYVTRWLELLTLNRVNKKLTVTLVGQISVEQQHAWQQYLPNAILYRLSDSGFRSADGITRSDLVIALELQSNDLDNTLLAKVYRGLNQGGAMLLGPMPEIVCELENSARAISSKGVFPDLIEFTEFNTSSFSPKIPNSRNPIFVSGKGLNSTLEKVCLMVKPSVFNGSAIRNSTIRNSVIVNGDEDE